MARGLEAKLGPISNSWIIISRIFICVVAVLHFDAEFKFFLLMKRGTAKVCAKPIRDRGFRSLPVQRNRRGPTLLCHPNLRQKQPQFVRIGSTSLTFVRLMSFWLGPYFCSLI